MAVKALKQKKFFFLSFKQTEKFLNFIIYLEETQIPVQ